MSVRFEKFTEIADQFSFSTALSKLLEAYGYEISQMDVDCMAHFIYEASENYKHCRKSLEELRKSE